MRSLVLVTDDIAVARRIRSAVRYAAALRLEATLDPRGSTGEELARYEPDVVLVADSCQRMNTISQVREVRRRVPAATVLLFAARGASGSFEDAFLSGVDGIVSSAADDPALGALLGQIGQGHLILSSRHALRRQPADTTPSLRVVAASPPPAPTQDARGTRANA